SCDCPIGSIPMSQYSARSPTGNVSTPGRRIAIGDRVELADPRGGGEISECYGVGVDLLQHSDDEVHREAELLQLICDEQLAIAERWECLGDIFLKVIARCSH